LRVIQLLSTLHCSGFPHRAPSHRASRVFSHLTKTPSPLSILGAHPSSISHLTSAAPLSTTCHRRSSGFTASHGARACTLALTLDLHGPRLGTSHLCLRAAPRLLGISDASQSYIGAPLTPLAMSHSVHSHRAALRARRVLSTKNLPRLHLSPSGESHHVLLMHLNPLNPFPSLL
jgi:hypothetical protein